ncbi:hypothetical protein GLOIN_2v888567 [Rhizophagus irregularis DAOM 181602=DAOM 197198]|uniref:DUF8211 domain-containing protein n=1 Tax=Rhizophagus irregularis (strain DAOM 181602 / DAOM 197198 / MUCL 43194) TaxID=747089 RepID=A0A2P4QXM4_RHIID|nr:hypothetical protein GLOIN_2v888567 [Rhizophagus irregularis DAOM 181602=DAOM 197198]POG82362.1 hypothetical protein GLOIN_2v888567 [Rhizophagus irregularis DAOM 181602=DAOM 197198]|eukprot:XP_025189228.1 hypothetical protein GLOIN_2v888567 [Rhizophagus irregularis DAOM 181602=DAOM 197198]
MSHNRRACVSHQKNLDIFHNIKKHTLVQNNNTINNKRFHANYTYHRWHYNVIKHIHSNRLGISYDVSYLANGYESFYKYRDRRMYRKRLDNFCSHHSDSSKRSKKQKARFQRACRSVFYNRSNNKKKLQKRVDSLEEKLHRATQHRFLFLPSQHINKPIQHLKYHKKEVLRDEEYYNFYIPPDPIKTQGAFATVIKLDPPLQPRPGNDSIRTSNISSPANTLQPALVKDENIWHDKLGIWIPNDLFPYVTDEPVYISKRQAKLKG